VLMSASASECQFSVGDVSSAGGDVLTGLCSRESCTFVFDAEVAPFSQLSAEVIYEPS
jgi:hypothetical protein